MKDTRPTPETDAAYQGLSDESMRRTVKQRTAMQRIERERDTLARWKEEMMYVESKWEARAVGKELGLRAGQDIRPNILPAIVRLKKERDEARERAGSKHRCWMSELRRVSELEAQIEVMRELLREMRDDEVNAQDEADKFLRDHEPSELSKMREAIKEAHKAISFMNELHSDGHSETANHALAKLKPFLP